MGNKGAYKRFLCFCGEEVHNKEMGYFHIVNFNGESSVNDIIETDDTYFHKDVEQIKETEDVMHDFKTKFLIYKG